MSTRESKLDNYVWIVLLFSIAHELTPKMSKKEEITFACKSWSSFERLNCDTHQANAKIHTHTQHCEGEKENSMNVWLCVYCSMSVMNWTCIADFWHWNRTLQWFGRRNGQFASVLTHVWRGAYCIGNCFCSNNRKKLCWATVLVAP